MTISMQGEFSSALAQTCFDMMDTEIDANKHNVVMKVNALFDIICFLFMLSIEWEERGEKKKLSWENEWRTTCFSSSIRLRLYHLSHGTVSSIIQHSLSLTNLTFFFIPLHIFGALSIMPKPIKSEKDGKAERKKK